MAPTQNAVAMLLLSCVAANAEEPPVEVTLKFSQDQESRVSDDFQLNEGERSEVVWEIQGLPDEVRDRLTFGVNGNRTGHVDPKDNRDVNHIGCLRHNSRTSGDYGVCANLYIARLGVVTDEGAHEVFNLKDRRALTKQLEDYPLAAVAVKQIRDGQVKIVARRAQRLEALSPPVIGPFGRTKDAHPYEIVIHAKWRVKSVEMWTGGIVDAIRITVTDPGGHEHVLARKVGGGGGDLRQQTDVPDDGRFRMNVRADKCVDKLMIETNGFRVEGGGDGGHAFGEVELRHIQGIRIWTGKQEDVECIVGIALVGR